MKNRVSPPQVPPKGRDDVYHATRQETERKAAPLPDPAQQVVIHRGR